METPLHDLPNDVEALKAALLKSWAENAVARAVEADDKALIAHQKLVIAKLQRQLYGPKAERSARLVDQLELTFEELSGSATEDELAAEQAAAKTTAIKGFTRKRPNVRATFPEHLPRERVVIDPPTTCACCGGTHLRKVGEDVTQTLEVIPRQWKVIETVREKFSCRDCETISQAPAPYHVIPRGWAGPSLLAMGAARKSRLPFLPSDALRRMPSAPAQSLFEKFGQHQPLNRQVERYAREGVPISLSTAADAVGASCSVLAPLLTRLEAHVTAAERLHGDDTTVPVLAQGKCDVGRCWVYVRDDRPFGGQSPPAAMFYSSHDRKGDHPQTHLARYAGILQADAFGGYAQLYEPTRQPGPILEAACWAHARRPFFAMADLEENARRKEGIECLRELIEIHKEIPGTNQE